MFNEELCYKINKKIGNMLKENKTYLPLQKTQNNIQDLNFPSSKKKMDIKA